jgi:lipoate-protein ligase A
VNAGDASRWNGRIGLSTGCESQAWNEERLAGPLTAPCWRLWRYERPVVILGSSQRRRWEEGREIDGVSIRVRASGGGAVLAGPWLLGLSVALPHGHERVASSPVASYRWLGLGLAEVLSAQGLPEVLAIPPEQIEPLRRARTGGAADWACFGSLSPWEVTAAGRKIAGLAQARRRHGVLLVAGILLSAVPWEILCRTLGQPLEEAGALRGRTISCEEAVPDSRIEPAAMFGAVAQMLEDHLPGAGC